jgi:DNA recombination protein RmuC
VGKHINKSQEAWDSARKRLSTGKGNLIRRTEELKKLGAKAKKSLPDDLELEDSAQTNLPKSPKQLADTFDQSLSDSEE